MPEQELVTLHARFEVGGRVIQYAYVTAKNEPHKDVVAYTSDVVRHVMDLLAGPVCAAFVAALEASDA